MDGPFWTGDAQLLAQGLAEAVSPQLGQLFPDLTVQQPIEKRVDSKGGIGKPGHNNLTITGDGQDRVDGAVEVEGEEWKPAAEELTYNQDQGEGSFIPTKQAFW